MHIDVLYKSSFHMEFKIVFHASEPGICFSAVVAVVILCVVHCCFLVNLLLAVFGGALIRDLVLLCNPFSQGQNYFTQ